MGIYDTREGARMRLNEQRVGHWNRWGPYLSERAWGTVREDYSPGGTAWDYFPHDHARSRAYRWSEDGIGGISDRSQYLCFALALWNGHDPILKERMFGLSNAEGNHGEDVKEYYWYLDNTPSHAYMRFRYKYPQCAYPYEQLVRENAARDRSQPEYELIDTGAFDESRYFDVDVTYAKAAAEDVLVRIEVANRGPDPAEITLLPTLWFRNTWSWGRDDRRPVLSEGRTHAPGVRSIVAQHWHLERYELLARDADDLLFTENETNFLRLYGVGSRTPYVKDAFHRYLGGGERDAVNPQRSGTKAAALYRRSVAAGGTVMLELRLVKADEGAEPAEPFAEADEIFRTRREESDEFYAAVIPASLSAEATNVVRQAFAGLLWSKQFYHYVVEEWLDGDPAQPLPPASRLRGRNAAWRHLNCRELIVMPDTWEFPWFASWDLAFHARVLAFVDPQLAKDQIVLMFREWYASEDGQVPAYEWAFTDVNPPVLANAALRVFSIDRERNGRADYAFLEEVFHKLLISFTWWTNRKDPQGNDIFAGGFLGLDNIGPFDRNDLPPGYLLGQVDATAWMAHFARNLFEIAMILADRDPAYEGIATKFWLHFITIANAINGIRDPDQSLWDERDGFFYERLQYPDGQSVPIRVHSVVGFVPLFSSVTLEEEVLEHLPSFEARREWLATSRPRLLDALPELVTPGLEERRLMSLVRTDQLRRLLTSLLDESEFLSPYGIRSVSLFHRDHPYATQLGAFEARLDYEPGESTTATFGGNSNWRGPIWMPINALLIEALERYESYYGKEFRVEMPTGSGKHLTLDEVARELVRRLAAIFLRGPDGKRPVNGWYQRFDTDPHWRDLISFHEYFHADTGRGCGASHQTGWTASIAMLLMQYGGPAE